MKHMDVPYSQQELKCSGKNYIWQSYPKYRKISALTKMLNAVLTPLSSSLNLHCGELCSPCRDLRFCFFLNAVLPDERSHQGKAHEISILIYFAAMHWVRNQENSATQACEGCSTHLVQGNRIQFHEQHFQGSINTEKNIQSWLFNLILWIHPTSLCF